MQESSLLPRSSPRRSPRPRGGELRRARTAHGRLVRHRRGGRHRCGRLHDRARVRLRTRSAPLRASRPAAPGRRRRRCPATPRAWPAPSSTPPATARSGSPGASTSRAATARHRRRHARSRRDAERADRDRRRRRRRRAPPGAGDRPRRRRAAGLQHGHQRGPPQHARRDRHHLPQARRSFAPPTIVDSTPSSAPAVAIGARRHGRRSRGRTTGGSTWSRWAPDGQIGKVKRFASPDGVVGLVAAAGERGAATLAWVDHRAGAGTVTQPAQPLLRPRARPDRGARLRGHPHGRLDQRLRARRQPSPPTRTAA